MRDILVQLDGSDTRRLDAAVMLAGHMGARLIGLFAQIETDAPSLVARRPSDHLRRAAAEAEATFLARCKAAGVVATWWQLPHGEPGYVLAETAFCARYADLVILGQWQDGVSRVPEDLIAEVVMTCGRPVLVIPNTFEGPLLGHRICVAWNASRESTRALHDAMPFLEQAGEVTVLAVREAAGEARPAGEPEVDIVEHLAVNGIPASSERLAPETVGVMDMLLSRCFDLGADLLVMGAQSGLARGAGTRYVLDHLTLPVLLSN